MLSKASKADGVAAFCEDIQIRTALYLIPGDILRDLEPRFSVSDEYGSRTCGKGAGGEIIGRNALGGQGGPDVPAKLIIAHRTYDYRAAQAKRIEQAMAVHHDIQWRSSQGCRCVFEEVHYDLADADEFESLSHLAPIPALLPRFNAHASLS